MTEGGLFLTNAGGCFFPGTTAVFFPNAGKIAGRAGSAG